MLDTLVIVAPLQMTAVAADDMENGVLSETPSSLVRNVIVRCAPASTVIIAVSNAIPFAVTVHVVPPVVVPGVARTAQPVTSATSVVMLHLAVSRPALPPGPGQTAERWTGRSA